MAFLMKNCVFVNAIRSVREVNKLRYIFTDTLKNKRLLCVIQSRNFSSENEVKLGKEEEKIVPIYNGSLTTQVRSIKIFTLLSSATGLLAQPMLYSKIVETGPTPGIIGLGAFYGFFILVSPLLIHLLTKRYVTHMEYDPKDEKYIAYMYTFFLRRKKLEFTPDDVKIPMIRRIFTTLVVKNTPLFVDPRMFDEPRYFSKMMGYDKPIDLSIDSENRKK